MSAFQGWLVSGATTEMEGRHEIHWKRAAVNHTPGSRQVRLQVSKRAMCRFLDPATQQTSGNTDLHADVLNIVSVPPGHELWISNQAVKDGRYYDVEWKLR
ncbi:MAG: hypothetical protein GY723_01600 [bacterium]|nr:hypothetical protein [bacterium]